MPFDDVASMQSCMWVSATRVSPPSQPPLTPRINLSHCHPTAVPTSPSAAPTPLSRCYCFCAATVPLLPPPLPPPSLGSLAWLPRWQRWYIFGVVRRNCTCTESALRAGEWPFADDADDTMANLPHWDTSVDSMQYA